MSQPPPFHFSLRAMFLLLAVSSLACAMLFAMPEVWAGVFIIILQQLVPAGLLAGVIWGGRHERALCIGALIPAALTLFTLAPVWILSVTERYSSFSTFEHTLVMLEEYDQPHRFVAALSWISSVVVGLFALAMRRYFFRA